MTKLKTVISKMLVVMVAALFGVLPLLQITTCLVSAEEAGKTAFESSNVLDDFKSSEINGKKFDLKDYPYDTGKNPEVISFIEYCYSYDHEKRQNYGLYVIVYNPKGTEISTNQNYNKLQMASRYDKSGNPTDYTKFNLEYISSSEGDYNNLFYKFKVVDKEVNGTHFADRVNSNLRRYDVSGIELHTKGMTNAKEYAVNTTYRFSGYAHGYGPSPDSPNSLKCDGQSLETIELDVKHTFYRTEGSSKGQYYQNQLDTVYFAVPNRFFDSYGSLQRIKAEWWEYKTKDIVVTSNSGAYNAILPYLGQSMGSGGDAIVSDNYIFDIGYSLGVNLASGSNLPSAASWGWNLSGYLHPAEESLNYLFKADGDISSYDPYADVTSIGGVTSNKLYEYILNYKTYNSGKLTIKDGNISADLFASDIDDYRKVDSEYGKIQQGYSYYDFDADVDLQKLSSWNETNPSFWDNMLEYGFWDAMLGDVPSEESRTVAPIYKLKSSDLSGSAAEIAERLLINVNDVNSLKSFYETAKSRDESVVLFRFATTDYYSAPVDVIEVDAGFLWSDKIIEGEAYLARESVFLDFDIIQLTFNKEGINTVIPVVSSPIDIVDDVTPPVFFPEEDDTWKRILAIILIILLLVILAPVLPIIVKLIVGIVLLPFRLIGAIIKAIRKRE